MMKHSLLLSILGILLALFLLTGCSGDAVGAADETGVDTQTDVTAEATQAETTEADTQADVTVEETQTVSEDGVGFAKRLVGKYNGCAAGDSGDSAVLLDIYFINGCLLAEVRDPYAAYWAMELIPTDEMALYSTTTDTIQAEARFFSGFSDNGAYWQERETYTLQITEVGVDFTSAGGESVSYIRDDARDAQHLPQQYREALYSEGDTEYPDSLIGLWQGTAADGSQVSFLIEANGIVYSLCQSADQPPRLQVGLAVIDPETAVLTAMTERVGWGSMPYFDTVAITAGEQGELLLDTQSECGILPSGMHLVLQRQPSA